MATEGFEGFYIETRDYGATAAFWSSMGFENVFHTDHGSGQWAHPAGGPYVLINENHDSDLDTHIILRVPDATMFAPSPPADYQKPFSPEHWGVAEALVRDPDGRTVSLHAPMPAGTPGPHSPTRRQVKYDAY